MVPNAARKGHSFKGVVRYVMHDKQADTSERVGFFLTENLPTSDPEKAAKCMAYTAMHADEIKRAAGRSTSGRKATGGAVYHYSLSWAKEETPTDEHMIAAGRDSLKRLGLEAHEAVIVGHTDEPQPHVHIIVNRVNPETGITATLSKDRDILQQWGHEYDKANGKLWCPTRAVKYEARARAGIDKAPRQPTARPRYQSKAEFHRNRQQAEERRRAEAAARASGHKERIAAAFTGRAGMVEAKEQRQQQDNRSAAHAVQREKDRFEVWANGIRAKTQSRQLEEKGELGRNHARQTDRLKAQLDQQYSTERRQARDELKAIAERQQRGGFWYRLIHAKADRELAADLEHNLASIASREAEARGKLEREQAARREVLSQQHEREQRSDEQQIERAHERREAEGWKPPEQEREDRATGTESSARTNEEFLRQVMREAQRAKARDERARDRDGGRERDFC